MKRPACLKPQTGACRSCGPSCQTAMPQACRIGRGDRRTPTDWVRTRRRTLSVPCVQRMKRSTPTARRVFSGRSDQLQPPDRARCVKRSTPLAGRVPSGRRTNVNSNRRTGPRTKDRGQLRRFDPRCLRRTNVNSASAAFPLGLSPCNRDHAPRFLWSETVVKAKQCNHYYQTQYPNGRLSGSCRQKSSQKFTRTACATSSSVRGSGRARPAAEAHVSPAPSACRRARSCAS